MSLPPQSHPVDRLTARVGELQMMGWDYPLALSQAQAEAELTPEERAKIQRAWAVLYLVNGSDVDITPFV